MSVLQFDEGDMFIFRTYKRIGDDVQDRWSNAYEAVGLRAGDTADLVAMATALYTFEAELTSTLVTFDSFTVSTWVPDSTEPYNPENFLTVPLQNVVGQRGMTAPLPPAITLYLKRQVTHGRTGKIYLRMCLDETDVELQGKSFQFADRSAMVGNIENAIQAANLDNYYAGTTFELAMAMIGLPKNVLVPQVRQLTDINLSGVSVVQLTHRWYNQAQPT